MSTPTPQWVGSTTIRIFALVLALGSASAVHFSVPSKIITVTLSLLCLLTLIHTSRWIFALWMRGAVALGVITTTIVFGLIYLALGPAFALARGVSRRLSRTTADSADTYWVDRPNFTPDRRFFERMG